MRGTRVKVRMHCQHMQLFSNGYPWRSKVRLCTDSIVASRRIYNCSLCACRTHHCLNRRRYGVPGLKYTVSTCSCSVTVILEIQKVRLGGMSIYRPLAHYHCLNRSRYAPGLKCAVSRCSCSVTVNLEIQKLDFALPRLQHRGGYITRHWPTTVILFPTAVIEVYKLYDSTR